MTKRCTWPDCRHHCHEPCEPVYEPLRFPDRPVFPQDPATFDDAALVRDVPRGAPWIVGATLLAFAFVLYCIAVAEVR